MIIRNEELGIDGGLCPHPLIVDTVTFAVGEGCSPLGRRHEVTEGEASPPRNAAPASGHLSNCYVC